MFSVHSVVKVVPKGTKKVMDLEMKSKFHNFFANGMAVGNSHSLCYSVISARCLYLKTYFPAEYYTAVLCHLKTGDKRIKEYIQDGRTIGLKFEPCNINKSKNGFSLVDDTIIIGFDKIKGISKEAEKIIELQPFSSFEDYLDRYGLGKKSGECLIKVGAFDCFNPNRKLLLEYFNYRREQEGEKTGVSKVFFAKMYKELMDKKTCPKEIQEQFISLSNEDKRIKFDILVQYFNEDKFPFFDKEKALNYLKQNEAEVNKKVLSLIDFEKQEHIKELKDFSYKEKCEMEFELYSFYFNHPIDNFQREGFLIEDVINSKSSGRIEGIITGIETKISKTNNPYYIISVEDEFNSLKILFWDDQYKSYKDFLKEGHGIRVDVSPSKFAIWNFPKRGDIEILKTLQEPTDEEEKEIKSNHDFRNLMNLLIKESNKGE